MNAKIILDRFEELKSERCGYESDWRSIRKYIRPDVADFSPAALGQPAVADRSAIMDGTAEDAAQELASGLSSYLTNPSDRWLSLVLSGQAEVEDPAVLAALEFSADAIYAQYAMEEAGFCAAMDECYLDIVSFGTGIISQIWDWNNRMSRFKSHSLASCWLDESQHGRVDTVYRLIARSVRQVQQMFDVLPPKLAALAGKEKPGHLLVLLNAVEPRTDKIVSGAPGNKPVCSFWVSIDTGEMVKESGYDFLPYHVARWRKLPDEVYGRGPGHKCLPDVKMLNSLERLLVKGTSRLVSPAMVVDDDAFLMPLNLEPDAVNYKQGPGEMPHALRFEGNLPFGEEKAGQKREFIRRCFHNDWLKMEKKNVEMTAYEVQDRREEKLRMLAPNMGRLQSELLGPLVSVTYSYLSRAGLIPPIIFPMINRKRVEVEYDSPASRAQIGLKVLSLDRFMQRLVPLGQVAGPQVLTGTINIERYIQALARYQGVPRTILNTPDEIQAAKEQNQRQQVVQQASQLAPVAQSIKTLSEAKDMSWLPL